MLKIICECYYRNRHTFTELDREEAYQHAYDRAKKLAEIGMHFITMTTRRAPCLELELAAIKGTIDGGGKFNIGTSHVEAAAECGIKMCGTTGHKYQMILIGLHGIERGIQRYLESWRYAFGGDLGNALTDTITTPCFLRFFGLDDTLAFTGARQDSGPTTEHTDLMLKHYSALGVNSIGKQEIYSNFAEDDDEVVLNECAMLKAKYKDYQLFQSAGMGRFFLYYPEGLRPLNIVMKASRAQLINQPYPHPIRDLVKISDSPGKAIGKSEALKETYAELRRLGIDM
jgi:nicotinate phosphoribosyltransferase